MAFSRLKVFLTTGNSGVSNFGEDIDYRLTVYHKLGLVVIFNSWFKIKLICSRDFGQNDCILE